MPNIASFLTPEQILASCQAQSKKQALQEIAWAVSRWNNLPEQEILQGLLARERLGSTATGHGVALPHARFAVLENAISLFVQLESPVDFDAPDGLPVDLLFVLLVPEAAQSDSLRIMARMAKLLGDRNACTKLREAVTSDNIYDILVEDDAI